MAGDWIKMRVSITRDTRVIAIADFLSVQPEFMRWLTEPVRQSCKHSAYDHVTRNVIVSVTVTALLAIWGLANEIGEAEEDDLILPRADLDTLDEIGGIPCIGAALADVGWAESRLLRSGHSIVRLPKFLKNNVPSEGRGRSTNAERQRRYRQNKKNSVTHERNAEDSVTRNATHNVTVTDREEKRREEVDIPAPAPKRVVKAKPKRTTLPPDFTISPNVLAWAKQKGHGRLEEHLDAFKRKAIAKGYEYVDWDAAFMEAVREDWARLRTSGAASQGFERPIQ